MKTRETQSEQLDNLLLKGDSLHGALKSLAWINQFMGNRQKMLELVWNLIEDNPVKRHFYIIDLACGGGDMLLVLAKFLQKKGVSCSLTGIDGNQFSLKYAQEKSSVYPTINYLQADILDPKFRIPACDILISSHFLYHFSATGLVNFINNNMPYVRLAFLNSGLERRAWASRLFKVLAFLIPISRLAKEDGLLAIRRAFTKNELLDILEQTSYKFVLKRTLFFRLMLYVSAS